MSAPTLLTLGPANVDETLTTTLVNSRPGIKDNIFTANNMLKYLRGKNMVKVKGGASISHGLLYAVNSTAKSYSRYGIIDTTPQDGMTRDQWPWKQHAATITIDGFTERTNQGEYALVDALETKRMQAEESLSRILEQQIFAASPATDDLRSLPVIILASGTEGQVNGTTSSWWQSTATASGSWVSQGRSDLETLLNTLSIRNPAGYPDGLVSDQTTFEYYKGSLAPQLRFGVGETADLGIRNLSFDGLPWFWSNQATAGVIYAITNAALTFYVHEGTDFITTKFVEPTDQDARTAKILVQDCLATGMRRKLGKLTGLTA